MPNRYRRSSLNRQLSSTPFQSDGSSDTLGSPEIESGAAISIVSQLADGKVAAYHAIASQQFIQQVADAVPGLLYVYDVIEQRNVYVNHQIQEILGYTPAQIAAMGSTLFAQLIHPDDLVVVPIHHARFDRAQATEALECEYRMRDVRGEWRWFLSRDTVFRRTEDGRVWQILGTAQDITKRKQTEQSLQASQARYATLAQNVPGVIYQYQQLPDGSDAFLYISSDCQELLGISPEAVLADSQIMWDGIHPDDRAAFVASIPHHAEGGTEWRHEWRILQPDHSIRWIKGVARAERCADGSVLWDGILIDATERKEVELALRASEERYRSLAEAIPQLIWAANAEGGLDDINQRWSDYTGLTLDQAQTDGWVQIVHPDDLPTLLQSWMQAQETRSLYQTECRMRSKTGEYRWFLVKAIPVQDSQGNVVKWYGTSTDIDDQKQLMLERLRALELEQAARIEAEKANRTKDDLLLMLSHELRTPLNPILGWSRLLQTRQLSPEKMAKALLMIERNAERQLQLVEDLLDVASLMQGKIQLKPNLVNLEQVIETAIERIGAIAEAKSISIERAIAPSITPIWGDPHRLEQIVWNLLTNAVKFTPKGGQIKVDLASVTGHPSFAQSFSSYPELMTNDQQRMTNYAQITISDTGIGIEPEFLPHIFELFRQSDSSLTRQHGGLGLGLTIVRHLVELHHGTIEAHSAGVNKGATFIVRLPLIY